MLALRNFNGASMPWVVTAATNSLSPWHSVGTCPLRLKYCNVETLLGLSNVGVVRFIGHFQVAAGFLVSTIRRGP